MPSRKLFIILFGFSLILSGCDKFLKSRGNAVKPIMISSQGLSCMSSLPAQMETYFQDQASVAQTDAIFTCVDQTISTFNTYAAEDDPNQFTAEQLRNFANRYFHLENQIDTNFMSQLMKLKVFFIGGSDKSLNRNELQTLRSILQMVKTQAQLLRGQWRILLFAKDLKGVSEAQIASAQTLASQALTSILDTSRATSSDYSWGDFEGFVISADIFLKSPGLLTQVLSYMPLADAIRGLFLGSAGDMSKLESWHRDADWTCHAYGLLAQVIYLFRDQDVPMTKPWAAFMRLVDQPGQVWSRTSHILDSGVQLLLQAPQLTDKGLLEVGMIDRVIDEAYKLFKEQPDLSADFLKDLYKQVLAHIIQGPRDGRTSDFAVTGIFPKDLVTIRTEVDIWRLTQSQILQIFTGNEMLPYSQLVTKSASFDLASVVKSLSANESEAKLLQQSFVDWNKLLQSPHPILFQNGFEMRIHGNDQSELVKADDLTYLNSLRSLIRLFLMGYGTRTDDNLYHAQMDYAGFAKFNSDFKSLLLTLHLVDPRQTNSARRMFDDTRFFSFDGTGKDQVNASMILQEIALMISGGKVSVEKMMTDLQTDGCLIDQVDTGFSKKIARTDCFEASLKKNFSKTFANLPNLTFQVQSGRLPFEKMFEELKVIGSLPQSRPGFTEYGELRQIATVLNYLEGLMAVYDTNSDQRLSQAELAEAFPRFDAIISKISPLNGWFTRDVFYYVVYKGSEPETRTVEDRIQAGEKFLLFKLQESQGLGSVGRMDLLKVISLLKSKTSSSLDTTH